VDTSMKLALVGDAPYAAEYIAKVRDTRDPRIVIPGAIYGDGYRELQSHCFAYVHATSRRHASGAHRSNGTRSADATWIRRRTPRWLRARHCHSPRISSSSASNRSWR
jgi:hypothetical protein